MKKSVKSFIIFVVIFLLILIIAIGTYNYLSSHLFPIDSNAKNEVKQKIQAIEDKNLRQNIIEHFLESNMLTKEEANSLY